jgi:phosphohistidine phosphatase
MKILYLVRHARAELGSHTKEDVKRELMPSGIEDALKMGQRLLAQHAQPQLIVASSATRTLATAELIASKLHVSATSIQQESKLYNASFKVWLDVIHDLDEQYERVMLVGHNPGITQTVNYFGGEDIASMPTAGVYAVSFDVEDWQAVHGQGATALFFDSPKFKA